jgi:hypothetical protein
MVIARSGSSAHDSPNERDPSDWLGELETNLPNVSCSRGPLDTEELTYVGGSIGYFFVGFGGYGGEFGGRFFVEGVE